MQIKNSIILLHFGNIQRTYKNKQVQSKKLFVYLAENPKSKTLSLINSEIHEDETFEENTRKEVWNLLHTDSLNVLKGEYYDSFEDRFGERIVHCSSICILEEQVIGSSCWYEIELSSNELILKNDSRQYRIKFDGNRTNSKVISSDILLAENNTGMLIDALLKLKNEFYFSPMVLRYANNSFTITELADFFNCFTNKPFSKATIKRRLSNYIEETENTSGDTQTHYIRKA